MTFGRILLLSSLLLVVAGINQSCGNQENRTPSIGEAYVGPATLNLRQDLNPKSPVTAAVHHGEKLEILEYKRRFIRVRTAGGIAGWTDTRQLLTPDQMKDLARASGTASKYPSQGVASIFEALNVHTEPNRTSPSFAQIPDNGKVDVIGHRMVARELAVAAPAPQQSKPKTTRRRSKDKAGKSIGPPPFPPAPKPPPNWLEMSKPLAVQQEEAAKRAGLPKPELVQAQAKPLTMEDWSLVRTKDGKVGWVLSRALSMAIPDDVAQYAEGHRITSYFQFGDVQDEDQVKHNWLWTTISKGPQDYEFDSFRFFIWSKRHHRYETAYIDRKVTGHYPVEVNPAAVPPTFTLLLDGDDGTLYRKTFKFEGGRIYLVNKTLYEPTKQPLPEVAAPPSTQKESAKSQSWFSRLKQHWSRMWGK